jgi:EAL domain-containing protein (putative c-di-GMP-specific phosphodiesterase class I)
MTFFTTEMKKYSVTQLGIGAELRRAIDCNELVLFYQPKIRLTDRRVVSVEALIRWLHPMRGFMQPGLFIPEAEESALIHQLTDWVLNAALEQASSWRKRGLSLMMSVNLSAANLHHELPDILDKLLSRHNVEPETVMLEITESALMADPIRALNTIERIKAMKVKISIDDFGTGYS